MQRRASARRLDADPWIELFEEGCRRRADGRTEVVPYWVFSQGDDAKIERHLPFLPMSREDVCLTELRTSLAAYRLAFGQPRQEDLVAYLTRLPSDDRSWLDRLQIDLRPPSSRR